MRKGERRPTAVRAAIFSAKVAKGGPDECWPWLGSCHRKGYGQFGDRSVGTRYAHRIAWEFAYGTIPDGMLVCHACDNPPCCNPSHLFLGTDRDNAQDRERKGRRKPAVGSKHGSAKLTEEQVREIRSREGISLRALGRLYGMSPGHIGCIRRGDKWKHVDGEEVPR